VSIPSSQQLIYNSTMIYVLCWNTCGGLANGLVSTSFPPRLHAWWWRAIRVEARHIARLQPDIQQKAVVSSHGQGASDEEKRGRGRTRPGPEARVQNGGQGRTQVKGHKPRARAGEERIRGASGGRGEKPSERVAAMAWAEGSSSTGASNKGPARESSISLRHWSESGAWWSTA